MLEQIGRKKLAIAAACLCALVVIVAAVSVSAPAKGAEYRYLEIGYQLSSTVISENFASPSNVDLSTNGNRAVYNYTDNGLQVTLKQNASTLNIDVPSTTANAVRLTLNVSALDPEHYMEIETGFKVKSTPSWYYGLTVQLAPGQVLLVPEVWLGEGTPPYQNYVFNYDVQERGMIDMVILIDQGNLVFGLDGFEKTFQIDYKKFSDLHFDGISVSASSVRWQTPAEIVVHRFELGNNAGAIYHDHLHTTLTPWGHDFTLALQLHADSTNPAQLALMKVLADEYEVRGEFDGWMAVMNTSEQYGIGSSAEYTAALHALQASGWDIGLHAVTQNYSTRTELLVYLDQFEQEFGHLDSWVDHGKVSQDMWQEGNNRSSVFYISDWLIENEVMVWVNEENHSHSSVHDLNLDSVMYHHDSYPGMDLQKVSSTSFLEETNNWQDTFAPVTQDELSDRQRVYAANNAVLLWHDYAWRYVFVEDSGLSYARQSHANMGYPYVAIQYEEYENANIHPNGTWRLKPVVEQYFAALSQDYSVWYATPHQVYDRSIVIQQLKVVENETAVTITNPTASAIEGFTLYTKELPLYCLKGGDIYHYARSGPESYQFVIPEIPAGSTIVLTKSKIPSFAPVLSDVTLVCAWGDQGSLNLRALKDGNMTMASNLAGDNLVLIDLTNDHVMDYQNRTSVALAGGHTYKITRNDVPRSD